MRVLILISLLMWTLNTSAQNRIVSLAPHTTELVFALGMGEQLVAVSDFSDYPQQATTLPSVASHNGVNFEKILRLNPDLILAWRGGNKPQDLARLESMGFSLFYSSPETLEDIATEIKQLGKLLEAQDAADKLSDAFIQELDELRIRYHRENPVTAFYYLWPSPLMSIGKGAWANNLLRICGIDNVFGDSLTDYPQVTIEQVIKKQPQLLLAAMNISEQDAETFWQPWRELTKAPVRVINPDLLHRFTPRILRGIDHLCSQLN